MRFEAPKETGGLYDAIAAKIAVDVLEYLVKTAELDEGFLGRMRSMLLGEAFIG